MHGREDGASQRGIRSHSTRTSARETCWTLQGCRTRVGHSAGVWRRTGVGWREDKEGEDRNGTTSSAGTGADAEERRGASGRGGRESRRPCGLPARRHVLALAHRAKSSPALVPRTYLLRVISLLISTPASLILLWAASGTRRGELQPLRPSDPISRRRTPTAWNGESSQVVRLQVVQGWHVGGGRASLSSQHISTRSGPREQLGKLTLLEPGETLLARLRGFGSSTGTRTDGPGS